MNFYSSKAILKYVLNIKSMDPFPPQLHKIGSLSIPDAPHEIRLFMVVRNESLRLPYLFKYYFSHGVDRIFVIDNNSQDNTRSFLLSQKHTHVFHAKESYMYFWDWVYFLLGRYGLGHWCIVVDADEIFIYPHWERLSIRDLCDFLVQQGYTALHGFLLDMYSDKPICKAGYISGSDPLLEAQYFDPDTHYIRWTPFTSQRFTFWGGVRRRVFGFSPCLSKVPLFQFNTNLSLFVGAHFINKAVMADICAAVLHFKYFSDFCTIAKREAERKEHWNNAHQYVAYAKKILREPSLSLYYENSARFTNSEKLVKMGIMKDSVAMQVFARSIH